MSPADAAWPWLLGGGGAVIGSFAATLVVRWPRGDGVTRGRSACDSCGATLRAFELVPILSYVASHGRCRRCGGRIDPRHPGVEGAAVAVGAIAGIVAPGADGVVGAGFGWLLLVLAAFDLSEWWLPDAVVAVLALAGLVAGWAGLWPPPLDRAIGALAGWGVLAAIGWGYARWRGREGLGGGDPKLFGAIGAWLGWRALPPVALAACAIGFGVLAVRASRGRRVTGADRLPFGALLAPAAFGWWCWMMETGW